MKKYPFLICVFLIVFNGYGQSETLKGAKQLMEAKKFQAAESLLESYVEQQPNDIEGIELLGDAYGQQKKWDDAIDVYEKLTEIKPNNANYHYKYGGALGMKALSVSKIRAATFIGDVKNAFLKAAELDPKHINTRWALVELYMQLPGIIGGSKSKSLKYAEELEALSEVDGYLAKGYIYEYDDEPELAEAYYLKAIKVGGSLTCYDKLTQFYETNKRPEEAIQNIEAAHKKHQRNALHYQIGKVAAEYNTELDKGEHCLKAYIKNHSAADGVPKAWAYYRLAQIHKHKKQKTEAVAYINKAIDDLPDIEVFHEEKTEILNL
ncbi:tetratricopeptide repeat protein [Psychroserpens sp. XS_ASV72]|uniref:tetratricopeptide repeat protein n=1 Tax=Psychroserpens sp. XS_ASV72 TaxID=3241293 RepID=UPI0035182E9E